MGQWTGRQTGTGWTCVHEPVVSDFVEEEGTGGRDGGCLLGQHL